ncbi:TPA: SIR2 family protein [Photobacterium damselae]
MNSTWCQQGGHSQFDCLTDFNDWLEGEDALAEAKREDLQIDQFSSPSKALFAGDKNAYIAVLNEYRKQFMQKALSSEWLTDICNSNHWYVRNENRFLQLLNLIEKGEVVPFIGAGLSKDGGFPTWKEHLKAQGRTAGLDSEEVDQLITNGEYEQVIHKIEQRGYLEAFEQELEDAFCHVKQIPETTQIIAKLFTDTVITTNYDKLLECTFENEMDKAVEVIDNREPNKLRDVDKVSVIKLHGDINTPQHCIMSQNHYNAAYGFGQIDLTLSIPKFLKSTFTNSSLLFLGCSLNNDRTVDVFRRIKQRAREDGLTLPKHFSIEQVPFCEQDEFDEDLLTTRNQDLLNIGITPIWFPTDQFDVITEILKFMLHEMNYRKAMTDSS